MSARSRSTAMVTSLIGTLETRRRGQMARFGLLMVFVGLSPMRGQAADPTVLQERHNKVVQMSQLERDKLQRNLAEFQQLSADQQRHYRELHRQIEETKSTGSNLSNILQEYSAWLTTLTPSQRDELHKETDPAKKLALVLRFKDEQEYRPESPSPEIAHYEIPNLRKGMGPTLSRSELGSVMKEIAKGLTGRGRDRPENEWIVKHYLEVLKQSIEQTDGGGRNWPPPELQRQLEQIVERSEFRELFKRRPDKREPLIRMIFSSLQNLAFEEFGSKLPNEADLQSVLESLERDKRDEITRLPREQSSRQLTWLYFKQRGDDMPMRMGEVQRQIGQLHEELGLPRPQPPFGGPFRPGSFDRRPDRAIDGPDERRPGDRPPPRNGQERPKRKLDD